MKEQKKKDYEVPSLTVVDFKTERGYAFSSIGDATRESYGNNDGQGEGGTSNNNQSWF